MCQHHSGFIGRYMGAIVLALLLGLSSLPTAQAEFTVPPNDGFVTDDVNLLKPDQKAQLAAELERYKAETSNEIAVLIINSLNDEILEDAALKTLRTWGIGDEKKDNGILILVVYADRKIRIEVGYGLEGAVTDSTAVGIAEKDMQQNFRDGKYYEGIRQAVDSLEKHIGGEYTADRYDTQESFSLSPSLFFFGFILLQWLIVVMSRTKSWWLGGVFGGIAGIALSVLFQLFFTIPIFVILGLVLDFLISKNYHKRGPTSWWAGGGWGPGGGGWGGSGGGGGGFSGFSGGSGGGGGGSSSW
ncbi:MAG: TPM domain-containing protein [Candidatus Peribacteraceae bacterium]|nr:TPM domain-containing protein [Candidatus Peribacteraceae bacterium]